MIKGSFTVYERAVTLDPNHNRTEVGKDLSVLVKPVVTVGSAGAV